MRTFFTDLVTLIEKTLPEELHFHVQHWCNQECGKTQVNPIPF